MRPEPPVTVEPDPGYKHVRLLKEALAYGELSKEHRGKEYLGERMYANKDTKKEPWTKAVEGVDLQNAKDLLLAKVGLLTAVQKVGSAVTHGSRGMRHAFEFKEAAGEETLQEHDIRGCHGAFWYLLRRKRRNATVEPIGGTRTTSSTMF